MLAPDRHAGASMVAQGRDCRMCHTGQEALLGNKIIANPVLEPQALPGAPGSLTVKVNIAHDGERIYFRVTWPATNRDDKVRIDPRTHTRFSLIFGDESVTEAATAGCWATCHSDNSAMANATSGTQLTKYLDKSRTQMGSDGGGEAYRSDAELARLREAGVFLEYWQVDLNPGADALASDGYVLEQRRPFPDLLIEADATIEDGVWTVIASRKLISGDASRKDIVVGKTYPFGIAIHENYTSGRFHYVSLEHTFVLGEGTADFIVAH